MKNKIWGTSNIFLSLFIIHTQISYLFVGNTNISSFCQPKHKKRETRNQKYLILSSKLKLKIKIKIKIMDGIQQLGLPILGIIAAAAVTFYAVSFSEIREVCYIFPIIFLLLNFYQRRR